MKRPTRRWTARFERSGIGIGPNSRSKRICGRADTSRTLISDEEFYSGLAALEEAAARETSPTPVLEIIELLILQATESQVEDGNGKRLG